MMTCIWPITNWAWVGWRHANHTKCGYMSDEINDKNDDGTNVADAVSPSGEIEVLDIKRADSSSGRNGGKGGRNGGRREYKPFPGWLYGVLFVVFDMAAVAALQWGVSQSGTRVQLSSPVVGWGFVSKMWTKGNFVFVLNLLLIGALYLALLMLFNRFWIATPVLLAVAIIVGVIEHFKVSIRYEAILPSDLGFLGSNTGNLMSFTPPGAHWIILGALAVFLVFVALFVVLNHVDGRHGRMIRFDNKGLAAGIRLMVFLLPSLFFGLYCDQVSTVGSWANGFSKALGDTPSMWDSVYDAQRNGPLVSFTRQLNPTIMDEPSDYSEATMKEVVKRYEAAAEKINASRTKNMTDSTVVYVLSESFSDPARVPGVKLNKDAIPEVRAIKSGTTSGLMLSSGYGGGTANLEYMGLSGLSMANFDSSLTSPYQQLVPGQHWTPTINQMWGAPKNSIAFHPYEPSMYSRATNYKKFGFAHFYTLQGDDIIKHRDKIDRSPYVSDKATYQSALEDISSTDSNQFIQIITMQNHMPYNDWYADNEFKATAADGADSLGSDEVTAIDTYAKGASITDTETKNFLDELNQAGDGRVLWRPSAGHLRNRQPGYEQFAGAAFDGLFHMVQQGVRLAGQEGRQQRVLVAELFRGADCGAHEREGVAVPGVPDAHAQEGLRHGAAGGQQDPGMGPHPRGAGYLS